MKILLFNPSGAVRVYNKSKIKAAVPKMPQMSLAMIAGALLKDKHSVKIADLSLYDEKSAESVTCEEINEFKPDFIGVTSTTPLFYEACRISDQAKAVSKNITTILGGPHASSLPVESLKESSFDIVVAGEGENKIRDIVKGVNLKGLSGVYSKQFINELPASGKAVESIPMDDLPFPALGLFSAQKYMCPKMIARNNPVGPIEMSRGCVFNCSFCNKTVHGRKFRIKSPGRIIEEFLALKKLGYREFHVLDDQFTTEIDKAKIVCEEIIRKSVNMTWNLRTGIRVDKIDKEFLILAKRAGCYQVGIGFETADQQCLDSVGKGIKLEQAFKAMDIIRSVGIESAGFFMLGFPGETVQTMEETITYAIKLDPDFAKATILVPFPGTRIYDEFKNKGLIKTYDWSKYNFHNANEIYTHPNLSWDVLNEYYDLFHKRFYMRPKYLIKRFWKSTINGSLLEDIYSGYQTLFEKADK